MASDGPPPPPPPHGSKPRPPGGLPDGNYDIFIIPPHSAGAGFLYLPSLQVQRNSFLAGVACTLLAVGVWTLAMPVLKQWTATLVASGGIGVVLLVLGVGVAGWAFGKTQGESGGRHGPGGSGTAGAHHQQSSAPPPHSGANGYAPPPKSTGYEPPPQANGYAPPPQGSTWGSPPPPPPPPRSEAPPPPPPPQTPPQSPPQPPPPPPPESPPKPKPASGAQTGWEKAREETRKREEERKRAADLQKKREEAQKLREEAEKAAKAKAEKEKWEQARAREKEQREREARERIARDRLAREKEQREKDTREREAREREAREKADKEKAAAAAAANLNAKRASPTKSNISATYQRPSAKSQAGTEDLESHSYRPYDKPASAGKPPTAASRPAYKSSASSISGLSESSYAPSATTARTTPPPSQRGPYHTTDEDKIVLKAVYLFSDSFPGKPLASLLSNTGSVTDGLILRVKTEGLFIDDDVRGVPQREWDVKAWTLRLVEEGKARVGGKMLHVLRATVRDAENKRYTFVLEEGEAWKVALGIGRLKKGSQVRALGVSGLKEADVLRLLGTLGWT